MATPGSLTIGNTSEGVNSTQNSNNSSATRTKGENGFTILASVYNSAQITTFKTIRRLYLMLSQIREYVGRQT